MKNTMLLLTSVSILALVFLLYQANLAIDSSDDEKYTLVEIAYQDGCLEGGEKGIPTCKTDAHFYLQELKNSGF